MKLESLELFNFRQYFEKHRIIFSTDQKKHVTVIHGINGAGKSSLFYAINWCLYGKEIIPDTRTFVSKEAESRLSNGEEAEMWSQLTFSHDGQRYKLRRGIKAIMKSSGDLEIIQGDDEPTMRRIGADGQSVKENSPLTTINAILPANVRTYFLFDGEKINEFAKPEAASEVKDAISLVLRLEILERARDHLNGMAQKYRKEIADKSEDDDLKQLEAEITEAEAKKDDALSRLEELKRNEDFARQRVEELDKLLAEWDGVQDLQKERTQVESTLASERKKLEKVIREIKSRVSRGYLIQSQPIISKALEILDKKRTKGEIPSNIRQQFVQDLLDQKECICGRLISEHSPEEQRLHQLLTESVPASLESLVVNTNNDLLILRERGRELKEDLEKWVAARLRIINQISVLEGKLSDLNLQLENSPEEEIRDLEINRAAFKADIEDYVFEQGEKTGELKSVQAQIDEKEKDLSTARKKSDKTDQLSRKMQLAKEGAKAIEQKFKAFADEMRQKIEAEANQIFHSLIWKESHFQRIQLGKNYHLDVIDRYGKAARGDLSAGERQVLSLSFITAMSKVSGEEAPLVMDTPFGRLSSHHRNSITKHIPELSSQLILFVTDEELHGEARANLKPYIGKEYQLDFEESTSCTQILDK